MKPLLVLALALLLVLGHTYYRTQTDNSLEAPSGGIDLILVGDNSLIASVIPAPLKLDILASRVTECESGQDHYICENGGYCDDGMAYGKWQFWEDTFYWFAEMAGFEGLDWKNVSHQDLVGYWALDNNYGNHWTCFRNL